MVFKFVSFLLAMVMFVSGCASVPKGKSAAKETEQLKMQIKALEAEIRQKDEQLYSIHSRLAAAEKQNAAQPKASPAKAPSVNAAQKAQPSKDGVAATPKSIQAALKKAGYYTGAVDGKIGSGTKKAICDFQSAHGLSADGLNATTIES